MATTDEAAETERVWLVERTYGDDEQNMIILTYATPDGRRDYRKERALPSFTGPARALRERGRADDRQARPRRYAVAHARSDDSLRSVGGLAPLVLLPSRLMFRLSDTPVCRISPSPPSCSSSASP